MEIPRINHGRDAIRTKLSDQDRGELLQLTRTPGYRLLLRLMEMECIMADVRLTSVDSSDEKVVVALQRVAKAKWEFFSAIQKQVEHEVNELLNPQAPPRSAAEKELDEILNPIQ